MVPTILKHFSQIVGEFPQVVTNRLEVKMLEKKQYVKAPPIDYIGNT